MKSNFQVRCTKSELKTIRRYTRTFLSQLDISRELQNNLVVAVDEASANAIIHGNQCNKRKKLEISFQFRSGDLFIRIADVGSIESISKAVSPDLQTLIREKRKGGMGLRIMHEVMDEVRYYRYARKNYCLLSKCLRNETSRGQGLPS